jgi:hydrogenase maturation protease
LSCPREQAIRTLVLGLGNDLYGDDAVGIELVRRLRQEAACGRLPCCDPEKTHFEECTLSGLALLDVITGYDTLLIVDTIKKEQPKTGRVRLLEADDLRAIPGPSPHYVSVPQTIEIGRRLGLHVPTRIRIVAVEAKNMYHLGEGISAEMAKALPRILARVKDVLKNLGSPAGARKRTGLPKGRPKAQGLGKN